MDFIAIDFETANNKRTSACSIGITTFKNGEIISAEEYLIKPYPYYFDPMNTAIHGITEKDVKNAPTFDVLWEKLSGKLENQIIIAHNASFDMSVLTRTLDFYNLPYPSVKYLCTYRIAKSLYPEFPCYRLDYLSERFNIDLCHHNACSDSIACAKLLLHYMSEKNITDLEELQNRSHIYFGSTSQNIHLPCTSRSHPKHTTSAKDFENIEISHLNEDFDEKNFVFTGTLLSMTRAKAMEIVVRSGGHPQDHITKATDYLVVGVQDLKITCNGQSGKMKKAAEYKAKGGKIEVIGEEQFVEMIDKELLF